MITRSERERAKLLQELERMEQVAAAAATGDPRAIDEQLALADEYCLKDPWMWDMMIDKVIAILVSYGLQLERAHTLAADRLEWCRDRLHLESLASVCRARGGRFLKQAEMLELEARTLEDRHPQYDDEPE